MMNLIINHNITYRKKTLINFSHFLKWLFNSPLFLAIWSSINILNSSCPGNETLKRGYTILTFPRINIKLTQKQNMIKQEEIISNIELTKNDIFSNVFNKDCHNRAARTRQCFLKNQMILHRKRVNGSKHMSANQPCRNETFSRL